MFQISAGTIIAAAQLHDCVVLAADRLHERQIMSDALLCFIDSAILPLVRNARQTQHADGSPSAEDAADIVTAAYCNGRAELNRFRVGDQITPIPGYRAGFGWLRRLLIHKPDGHLIFPAHFAPRCLFASYDRGSFVGRGESHLVAAQLRNVVEGFTRWDELYPDNVRECGAPVDVVIVNDRGVQIIY